MSPVLPTRTTSAGDTRQLNFQWSFDPVPELQEAEEVLPLASVDDPMGLARLGANWRAPTMGGGRSRWRSTVDMGDVKPGVFVAVVAEKEDEYSFEVEGKELWLGRVSQRGAFFLVVLCFPRRGDP